MATAIFTTGDLAAQQIEHGSTATLASFSGERTLNASALGLLWGGGISPTVYRMNERFWPGRQPLRVAKKMTLSICILGCCGNWGLIFCRRLLAGFRAPDGACAEQQPQQPQQQLVERLVATARSVNEDWPTVMMHDLKVWPLADLIVFTLLPVQWRVAFVSSVATCWQTYLSYTASRGTRPDGDARSRILRRTTSRPPCFYDAKDG